MQIELASKEEESYLMHIQIDRTYVSVEDTYSIRRMDWPMDYGRKETKQPCTTTEKPITIQDPWLVNGIV
jgi:hypothetical protein